MNRVRRLPLPVLVAIAVIGSWCLFTLIALAAAWLFRAIGAVL